MSTEQEILDAFERGKAFGFAEGMKSRQAEIDTLKEKLETERDNYCQLLNGEDY